MLAVVIRESRWPGGPSLSSEPSEGPQDTTPPSPASREVPNVRCSMPVARCLVLGSWLLLVIFGACPSPPVVCSSPQRSMFSLEESSLMLGSRWMMTNVGSLVLDAVIPRHVCYLGVLMFLYLIVPSFLTWLQPADRLVPCVVLGAWCLARGAWCLVLNARRFVLGV